MRTSRHRRDVAAASPAALGDARRCARARASPRSDEENAFWEAAQELARNELLAYLQVHYARLLTFVNMQTRVIYFVTNIINT